MLPLPYTWSCGWQTLVLIISRTIRTFCLFGVSRVLSLPWSVSTRLNSLDVHLNDHDRWTILTQIGLLPFPWSGACIPMMIVDIWYRMRGVIFVHTCNTSDWSSYYCTRRYSKAKFFKKHKNGIFWTSCCIGIYWNFRNVFWVENLRLNLLYLCCLAEK